MNIIRTIIAWRQRHREERAERRRALDRRVEIQRRYHEFEVCPSRHTRSPWIRSLVASPMWNDARAPGEPRKISLSHPEKAKGRDYILDMLELERGIRFRGCKPWRGIFSAMVDDAIIAGYPDEYRRILDELRVACPDETLSSRGGRTQVEVLGMANGMIADIVRAREDRS